MIGKLNFTKFDLSTQPETGTGGKPKNGTPVYPDVHVRGFGSVISKSRYF